MVTPDLPVDVWLYIAQFLPQQDLKVMLAVNSLFYNIAMDARYRDVFLRERNEATIWLVHRLADPAVGHRVKGLHMRLQEYRKPEPPPQTRNSGFRPLRYLLSHTSGGKTQKPQISSSSFTHFVDGLINAFPALVNLREFCIDAWDVPSDFDLGPFYATAWKCFGPTLHRATLGGNLEGYRVFTMSNPPFVALQELFIEFTNDGFNAPSSGTNSVEILSKNVGSLLRTLAPRLRVLGIQSWASLDLSSFFTALPPFPCIEYFRIRTPFNISFASDPSGLSRFLSQVSPTLRTLELRLTPTGAALYTNVGEVLSQWLHQTMSTIPRFRSLRTLQFYPTQFSGGLEALLTILRASQETLESLSIKDRYLQFQEVERVIEALGEDCGLVTLRLNVLCLKPELIHLLARRLPYLKDLTIYIAEAAINDLASPDSQGFMSEMEGHVYNDWKLWNIGVWQGGSRINAHVMAAFPKVIPSLGSLWDTGSLSPDVEAP
ncbi:hypothetical protein AX16_003848 [Volvariella volvacea WC 439]|nr:hypothetical protein AX16_003848 [Volvariella volvacea WC 439]